MTTTPITSRGLRQGIYLLMTAAFCGVLCPPAHAVPDEVAALAKNDRRTWQANWHRYPKYFTTLEEGILPRNIAVCAMYNPRYPSSRHMTVLEAEKRLTAEVSEQITKYIHRKQKVKPPKAESEAYAMTLPSLEYGAYGHLYAAEVEEVLGNEDMIVEEIALINEDRLDDDYDAAREKAKRIDDSRTASAWLQFTFQKRREIEELQNQKVIRDQIVRLVGYPTARLKRRDLYAGPQAQGFRGIVIGVEYVATRRDVEKRIILLNPEKLRHPDSEQALIDWLKRADISVEQFVGMVRDATREHANKAELAVCKQIASQLIRESESNVIGE